MADADGDSGFAQLLDDVAVSHVGALHLVAELVHHFGDPRHADSADSDEVDDPDVGAHRLHHAGRPFAGAVFTRGVRTCPTATGESPLPTRSTRSARSRAACGRPTDKARAAALFSATGSAAIASIWRASASGVKPVCWMVRAPPTRVISRAFAVWWSSVAAGNGMRIAGRPAA